MLLTLKPAKIYFKKWVSFVDFRKIKYKIALACKGDLEKYFSRVYILNSIIKKNEDIFKEKK